MNSVSEYSQFIYGKFATPQDFGYRIVARTADLTDEKQLQNMAETYRFWGARPPVRDNIKAGGLFLHKNNLVLAQVSTAVNPHTKQNFLSGSREFNQYRYVFVPIDSIASLEGKTFKLLAWILQQSIPIHSQFDGNLSRMQIPLIEQKEPRDQEVNNSLPSLNNINTERRWFLSAQDNLISGKRLLLTLDNSITTEDFITSVLLLLPAAYRSNISVAVGTLDEQQCGWAQLIVKSNGYPQGRLPDDLIWVNDSIKKWNTESEPKKFTSNYVSLINSIVDFPEKIPQLLQQLDGITDKEVTLNNPIISKNIIIPLIRLLPNEQQAAMRKKYLSGLSSQEWQSVIPLIQDYREGLVFACDELGRAAIANSQPLGIPSWSPLRNPTIEQPQVYIWLMFQVLKQLATFDEILPLRQLHNNLPLAEILLERGLLQQQLFGDRSTAIALELVVLCKSVVTYKSQQSFVLAWLFAKQLVPSEIFQDPVNKFQLLDAAFPVVITENADLLKDPDYPQMILDLIPNLPSENQVGMWNKYLSGLDKKKWETLIPHIDIQQELVIAWQQLKTITRRQLQEYAPLMLQVWRGITDRVGLLQELKSDALLAEALLEHGLLEQYIPEAETTAIVSALIEVCTSVVADKSLHNFEEAWKFATNLANKEIFEKESDRFWLLDSALFSEIPLQKLYDWFNFKLASLMAHVDTLKIRESHLYRQLAKDAKVAELLNTLFTKRNAAIGTLPQLAKLTNMKAPQQDALYKSFLGVWSPSYEDARELLILLIQQGQEQNNNFSRQALSKTYAWFENEKPELSEIFDNLQQTTNVWDTWDTLANTLYDNPQKCATFLDSVVGKRFSIPVLQKWLPIIVNNEDVRRTFLATSEAWQIFQTEYLSQYNFPNSLKEYAATLVRCLEESKHYHLINGDLLHYLYESWLTQKQVDESLRTIVTSPSVINKFKENDWLNLQEVSWHLGFDLKLSLNYPPLENREKESLFNLAFKVLESHTQPEQRHRLLHECRAWGLGSAQLKSIAIKVVELYTYPEQTQRLLNDCVAWGLDINERKDILKQAKPKACNINLILPYLYRDGRASDPARECELVSLLLQVQPRDEERADLKKFCVDVFTQYILPGYDLNTLKWWRDKATVTDKKLYTDAFYSAAQKYVSEISNIKLSYYLQALKKDLLIEECRLMLKASFNWGIPDFLIQPIIDWFVK